MDELEDSFDALTNQQLWIDAVLAIAGLIAPAVLKVLVEGMVDLPDEVYGIGVITGSEVAAPDDMTRPLQMGAGANVGIAVGNRFDGAAKYLPQNPEVSA